MNLFTAIWAVIRVLFGAMKDVCFGPDSHSRNRYNDITHSDGE